MDRTQYDRYLQDAVTLTEPTLSAAELTGADRTLAYGYDVDRFTWHAYLMSGKLHVVLYRSRGPAGDSEWRYELVEHLHAETLRLAVLRPNKRVYPEHCDLEFAELMRARDAALPFTTFDLEQWSSKKHLLFKGAVHTDFADGAAVLAG